MGGCPGEIMNPRLQTVLVAATLVILMGLAVFAAINFVPLPAAASYWLGMLLMLVGVACVAARMILGRNHPILQRLGAGSAPVGKNMARDGLLLLLVGATLVGIYYGDRYYDSYMARARFSSAFSRGIEASKASDWSAAIDAFSEAIRYDPTSPQAHFNLGLMQRRKLAYEDAIVSFTEAIRLDPNYAKAYRARGEVYRKIRDEVRAEEDLKKAAALDPELRLP